MLWMSVLFHGNNSFCVIYITTYIKSLLCYNLFFFNIFLSVIGLLEEDWKI